MGDNERVGDDESVLPQVSMGRDKFLTFLAGDTYNITICDSLNVCIVSDSGLMSAGTYNVVSVNSPEE